MTAAHVLIAVLVTAAVAYCAGYLRGRRGRRPAWPEPEVDDAGLPPFAPEVTVHVDDEWPPHGPVVPLQGPWRTAYRSRPREPRTAPSSADGGDPHGGAVRAGRR